LVGVVFIRVFHKEIVDDKAEGNWFVGVLPVSRCVSRWIEAVLCKSFLELLVGEDTSLRESVHSVGDLEVDPSIGCEVVELVEFDDFIGGVF